MLTLFAILFSILIAGAAGGFVLHDVLLSRLRARHPEIWNALGPPSKYFDDGGLAGIRAVQEFLRRPDYQRQCSPELLELARFIRIYDRICLVLALVLLAVGVVWFLGERWSCRLTVAWSAIEIL